MLLACEDLSKIFPIDVWGSVLELDVVHRRDLGECQIDDELEVVVDLSRSIHERCNPKQIHDGGINLLLVHKRQVSEVLLGSNVHRRG